MIIKSSSPDETKQLAQKIAKQFAYRSGVVGLIGDLGAGKTLFTQRFAQSLGIKNKILSPSFVIMRQYPIPKTNKTLYHIDLYRLSNNISSKELGFEEIFNDPNAICLVEWADKLANLPPNSITLRFQKLSNDQREIIINGVTL